MSLKYNLQQATSSEWNEFHSESAQESAFTTSDFLESFGYKLTFFFVSKGQEKVAGLPALTAGETIIIPPFSIDAGIHYSRLIELKEHTKNGIMHKVNEILAEELFSKFKKVSFNNHFTVLDVRAFDWFNYPNHSSLGGYSIRVLYTSHLNLKMGLDRNSYSQLRRRDLKTAAVSGISVEASNNIEELNRLHNLTFLRQGIERSPHEEQILKNITSNTIKSGKGKLYICKRDKIGVSAIFCLVHKEKAYYLFGANDPEFRETGAATFCMDFAIQDLIYNNKIQLFDFVGVNSPNRGAFKLSFGGSVVPYYQITKYKN